MPAIAVIDIGKTNAKLALIDRATGATLDWVARPSGALAGPPYRHLDTEGTWAFLLASLRAQARRHDVAGIAVTAHGATAALLGTEGLALPVLDYEDAGPDALAAGYDRARPHFAETLSPRLPAGLNLGAQLWWQARAFPQAFGQVRAVLTWPQYWSWRLTGVAASEVTSLGCHTDLWAPLAGRFSSLAVAEGWDRLFPPLRPAASVLGPILPAVAAATGLDPATPVACGIHDSNASLLPWLDAVEPPFTVISSGTWTVVMTVGGDLARLDPARDSLANVDALGRPVATARFMAGREHELLVPDGGTATLAGAAEVLAAGVLAVPPFVPGVGPFGHAAGGGRWVGSVDALRPGGRAAAAALYLALVTESCLGIAGVGRRLIVLGPMARNAVLCGALAALTGVPVHRGGDATGTSAGAALLLGGGPPPDAGPAEPPLALPGLADYARRWRALATAAMNGAGGS